MVDYQSYFQYGPPIARNGTLEPMIGETGCQCGDCRENKELASSYRIRFDSDEAQKKKEWEAEQYMLCPPRVLGYILRDKQWAQLQVDLVQPIPADGNANSWNSRLRLANDESTKQMLFDLVQSHISSTTKTGDEHREMGLEVDDIIPGKGKGLVILLYGQFLSVAVPLRG
jgi:hypothetical protein